MSAYDVVSFDIPGAASDDELRLIVDAAALAVAANPKARLVAFNSEHDADPRDLWQIAETTSALSRLATELVKADLFDRFVEESRIVMRLCVAAAGGARLERVGDQVVIHDDFLIP